MMGVKVAQECVSCGEPYEPYLTNEILCIGCSIAQNDYAIALCTDVAGNVQRKKLLKRRYQLREYNPVKHYKGASRINQECKGCGENFLTFASFKDRLLYCPVCQELKSKLIRRNING